MNYFRESGKTTISAPYPQRVSAKEIFFIELSFRKFYWFFLILISPSIYTNILAGSSLETSVNKTIITEGEEFLFKIKLTTENQKKNLLPKISNKLRENFEIFSKSTEIKKIDNHKFLKIMTYTLYPLKTGTLMLPAVSIPTSSNNKIFINSAPIALSVNPVSGIDKIKPIKQLHGIEEIVIQKKLSIWVLTIGIIVIIIILTGLYIGVRVFCFRNRMQAKVSNPTLRDYLDLYDSIERDYFKNRNLKISIAKVSSEIKKQVEFLLQIKVSGLTNNQISTVEKFPSNREKNLYLEIIKNCEIYGYSNKKLNDLEFKELIQKSKYFVGLIFSEEETH